MRIAVTTSVLSAVLLIGCQSSSYAVRYGQGVHATTSLRFSKRPRQEGSRSISSGMAGDGLGRTRPRVYLEFHPTDSLSAVANKQNPGKLTKAYRAKSLSCVL